MMLVRFLGTARVAVLAGGAYLLAGCGSFGAADAKGGEPGGGGNSEGSDAGSEGTDADAPATSSAALIGEWKSGLQVVIPPGTSRLLLVTVHLEDGADTGGGAVVQSVRLGQQTLTRVPRGGRVVVDVGGAQNAVELWYLDEAGIAAAADGFLEVALKPLPREATAYTHAFFSGIDQTKPFGQSAASMTAGSSVVVGPVFVPKRGLAVAACDVSDTMTFSTPNASLGVIVSPESHGGATAWAPGADADLSMMFELSATARRQATTLVALNPTR